MSNIDDKLNEVLGIVEDTPKEIVPKEIYSSGNDIWIVDMGKNFTGTYKLKIHGKKGDTITFRFGERIYEDGNLNPMTALCA